VTLVPDLHFIWQRIDVTPYPSEGQDGWRLAMESRFPTHSKLAVAENRSDESPCIFELSTASADPNKPGLAIFMSGDLISETGPGLGIQERHDRSASEQVIAGQRSIQAPKRRRLFG
jgi:hypothetical protein